MPLNRSLGGIGKLYHDDALLGEVYYNIKQEQPPGPLVCTAVFVGSEVDLAGNAADTLYSLLLENRQYMLVTLSKVRPGGQAPYVGVAHNGKLHTEFGPSHAQFAGD
jgi:hypothetical protein